MSINQDSEWNDIVKSFSNWDVYYLVEYARTLWSHGDGIPKLLFFSDGTNKVCYVVIESDISKSDLFADVLCHKKFLDWETPYGYGGPLIDISDISKKGTFLNDFCDAITEYCLENSVVSQFIRFHPLLDNCSIFPHFIETRYLRDTIYIDTTSEEIIMKNMDSKNRNMVRKAVKCGVVTEICPITDCSEFISMYRETMIKNGANDYYTFSNEYFNEFKKMDSNAIYIYAKMDGKVIGGALMLYNDRYMHYHLAGSHFEYRQYAPSNLILYDAACFASKMGITKLHLGGGMAPDDSLFGFKKQFNKNGRLPFVVGRTIFDYEAYSYLMEIRKSRDLNFDENNKFLIQYRG